MTQPTDDQYHDWQSIANEELIYIDPDTLLRLRNFIINDLDDNPEIPPTKFQISKAYPNPFNSSINFKLNGYGNEEVSISIYSIMGTMVDQFYVLTSLSEGQIVQWNPDSRLASGTYFINGLQAIFKKLRRFCLLNSNFGLNSPALSKTKTEFNRSCPLAKTKKTEEKEQELSSEAEKEASEKEVPKKKGKPSKVSSGSISMYLAEIGRFNPLPPEREVELAIRIQNNDERAMKELVEANLRFVVSVAKKYQGNGLSLADIINEGNMGLIKAAKRFDHTRGFLVISYAVWWIRQSILQALAEQSRLIRLPQIELVLLQRLLERLRNYIEVERQPKG